ncbi:MAG: aspartate kinase [Erysipelotrichaceae bacterium]|nr:aspartate kinase [Erysipelotrichaceae bacterium]
MIKISKFGGSSVADSKQFQKVKVIVESDPDRKYIVVSAPGRLSSDSSKITDLLYLLDAHRQYHVDASVLTGMIAERYGEIKNTLQIDYPIEQELETFFSEYKKMSQAEIVSRGEYFCARLMAAYLGYDFIDAKDVICFNHDKTVDFEKTSETLRRRMIGHPRFVFPGFYGADENGRIILFPRGGGDISGAVLARCMEADIYENWTDVSGFLTADPRIVKDPKPITNITYSELRELSYMGAGVLNEETVFPVRDSDIPIHILNTNRPQDPGTVIRERIEEKGPPVTGIAGKRGFTSIFIYKHNMSGEIGYIRKVLSVFEKYGVSIEHIPTGIDSFNLVVNEQDVEEDLYAILNEIRQQYEPDEIRTESGLAMVSTVGRSMSNTPGVSGKLFSALGNSDINIKMIAQNSDEINITICVEDKDFKKTIQIIYDTFIREENA